jgi:3-dehydroquinate dehydratase-2
MRILVINGPNLNMLGVREPDVYGRRTYADLKSDILCWARELGVTADIFQSNHEGAIVDRIQEAYGVFDGIVINAAAYSHTSVAILDALRAVRIPAVEVHISDVTKREPFRRLSYAGMACLRAYSGLGFEGYRQAMLFLRDYLSGKEG